MENSGPFVSAQTIVQKGDEIYLHSGVSCTSVVLAN